MTDLNLGFILSMLGLAVVLSRLQSTPAVAKSSKVRNVDGTDVTSNFPERVRRWADLVQSASERVGWEPKAVALATLMDESNGDPNAVGGAGEIGLMQIKPGAAEDVMRFRGVGNGTPAEDPAKNIRQGVAYLDLQRERWLNRGTMWLLFDTLRAYRVGFQASVNEDCAGAQDAIDRLELAGLEDRIPGNVRDLC